MSQPGMSRSQERFEQAQLWQLFGQPQQQLQQQHPMQPQQWYGQAPVGPPSHPPMDTVPSTPTIPADVTSGTDGKLSIPADSETHEGIVDSVDDQP